MRPADFRKQQRIRLRSRDAVEEGWNGHDALFKVFPAP